MARFMMVYKGDASDVSDMSAEQSDAVMAAWGAWMEKVGPALTDVGTPFGAATSIIDDGSSGDAISLTGYSIVDAEDMAAARALADGHPYLSEGKGAFAVDLFELMPVPFQE